MGANVVAGIAALTAGWIVWAFNRLVRRANLVREAWSGIDVQLKRRHDLVPNLVEVVRAHASYEKGVLEDVVRLRGQGRAARATQELEERENSLTASLRSVLAVVEAYPDLRASRSFLDLQAQLADVENHLQMARRYYNGTVRDYNIAVESFPSNLVARLFGYGLERYFQVESATERHTPEVRL
jgi:LemA protein